MRPLILEISSKWPLRSQVLRETLLIVGGSLFIALCTQISLPLYPVPVTAQTLAILLIGASYGATRGTLTVLTYLLEGVLGLPVFSGLGFGIAKILGPTGGYLLGFVLAAWVMGRLSERGWGQKIKLALPLFLLGEICIFTLGLLWLSRFIGTSQALTLGFYPFILGDLIKIILATLLLPLAWKLTPLKGELHDTN